MMYPKFIELHWNTIPLSYNVENISWFGDKFICIVGQDKALDVDESYDELKALITDCGCLIRKADPRLDTEHPLTMDDLMTMVGEPVWNSNSRNWMLVKDHDGKTVWFLSWLTKHVHPWQEDDLKKFPLYRMKRLREVR